MSRGFSGGAGGFYVFVLAVLIACSVLAIKHGCGAAQTKAAASPRTCLYNSESIREVEVWMSEKMPAIRASILGYGEVYYNDGWTDFVMVVDEDSNLVAIIRAQEPGAQDFFVYLDKGLSWFRYIGELPSAVELLDFFQSRFQGLYSIQWVEYPVTSWPPT